MTEEEEEEVEVEEEEMVRDMELVFFCTLWMLRGGHTRNRKPVYQQYVPLFPNSNRSAGGGTDLDRTGSPDLSVGQPRPSRPEPASHRHAGPRTVGNDTPRSASPEGRALCPAAGRQGGEEARRREGEEARSFQTFRSYWTRCRLMSPVLSLQRTSVTLLRSSGAEASVVFFFLCGRAVSGVWGQVYYLPDDLPDDLPAGPSASGPSESVASHESEESESDESEPDPVCLVTDLLLRGFWGETLQDLQQTQTRQVKLILLIVNFLH
ncbi:hypothetical protein EYF80_037814 [Liparis tanakae]|uniref:Uncharacterized protein n=1 Tax=Liparis tanakae TaxID=230148 RepID=A0A4Z2GGU9_9TELE|nr:hypothetical protein EYF80_037814 [Liparis tanakae]